MRLYSAEKTVIEKIDNTLYELSSFDYKIKDEYLKGTDITLTENFNLPQRMIF